VVFFPRLSVVGWWGADLLLSGCTRWLIAAGYADGRGVSSIHSDAFASNTTTYRLLPTIG